MWILLAGIGLADLQFEIATRYPDDVPTVSAFVTALSDDARTTGQYLTSKPSLSDRNRNTTLSLSDLASELRRCPTTPPRLSRTHEWGENPDRPPVLVTLICDHRPERVVWFRFNENRIERIDIENIVYVPVPPPPPQR